MSANERQVGGSHYQASYQHWDMVIDAGFGYFEGQITRYLARHYLKNGLQDVEKAEHYQVKMLEAAKGTMSERLRMFSRYEPQHNIYARAAVTQFIAANPTLGTVEQVIFHRLAEWKDWKELPFLITMIGDVKRQYDGGPSPHTEDRS